MPGPVLHLSHAADSSDSGIATSVAGLLSAQAAAGLTSSWCVTTQFPPLRRDACLRAAIRAQAPSLLHVHGLWRSATRALASGTAGNAPLVIAPHGMLDAGALAISAHRKRLVWQLWERRSLASAHCLHALCAAEAAAIHVLLPGAPVAVIPSGVSLPQTKPDAAPPPPPWAMLIPSGEPVLLFFGRFHRKKGLAALLQAWHTVEHHAKRHGWWLALVGYGDGGSLARQVARQQARGALSRTRVFGPAFQEQKTAVLSAASAFVLPSFSEGLPMAALEAMAHRLPCLLSHACNLPDAFAAGAALPAPPDPMALAATLHQLFALSDHDRAAIGAAGQTLVSRHYTWQDAAARTSQLYRWILAGGERPGFVRGEV